MAEFARPWQGSFGVGTQTGAIGTAVAAAKWQAIESETLKEERGGRQAQKAIRRNQDLVLALKGKRQVSGSVSGPLVPDDAFQGIILAGVFGNNNTVSGSATVGYTHVFDQPRIATPADWPAYGSTLEINRGSYTNALLWRYVGCFVKKYQIKCSKDGAVTVSVDYVGVKEDQAQTYTSPTFSTIQPFEGWMAALQVGANVAGLAALEVDEVTLTIDNGAKIEQALNGVYPTSRNFGDNFNVEIDFGYKLREDLTQFTKIFADTENAVKLTITHTTNAGSSSGVYSLDFQLPRVIFTGDEPGLSNSDSIMHSMKAKALYGSDGSSSYTIRATSVNSQSGTYAV